MDFFDALPPDLKLIAVGIAGCVLLALFSGNRSAEKRYAVVLAVLAAVGVYRFSRTGPTDAVEARTPAPAAPHALVVKDKHVPLTSTAAQ